jgi:hypothetical protein
VRSVRLRPSCDAETMSGMWYARAPHAGQLNATIAFP